MIKYKILICALVMFMMVFARFITPVLSNREIPTSWFDYVLIFIIFPVITWVVLGFAIKKQKERFEKQK